VRRKQQSDIMLYMAQELIDGFKRRIDYMRISVTDRCNLRCVYCNTSSKRLMSHDDILRYEEITRIVAVASRLGVSRIRLTGGEPMVRPHIDKLVKMLRLVPGVEELSMTTNAVQLQEYAQKLKDAGLDRVNISLDTFKPERFTSLCGVGKHEDVLNGITAAFRVGLSPVKTNTVVLRGVNDDELVDFARKSVTDAWNVRFIEEMPLVDNPDGYKLVPIEEIKRSIEDVFGTLEPIQSTFGNGPAKNFRVKGSHGSIGFIAPVTNCFCQTCNRFRLTADGKLRPCLLRDDEVDLRDALRSGASDSELEQLIVAAASNKNEKHQLEQHIAPHGRNMRQIGG